MDEVKRRKAELEDYAAVLRRMAAGSDVSEDDLNRAIHVQTAPHRRRLHHAEVHAQRKPK